MNNSDLKQLLLIIFSDLHVSSSKDASRNSFSHHGDFLSWLFNDKSVLKLYSIR
jgi:hypothetical protein